ncbi:MAG: HIT family protein [Actinomycetota bacterium]|jgi:histidine triad (HIT) family protein|nr:HIT family protein [Actinomycetota bacterium]
MTSAECCLFCDIIADSSPAAIVMADEVAVAFLDIRPLFVGHTLVVPREHHVTLSELPGSEVGPFFERVQHLSRIVPDTLGAPGSFVAMNNVVSQSVAHLHAHVVPRRPKDGLRGFFWPRNRYDDDQHMVDTADLLASAWARSWPAA